MPGGCGRQQETWQAVAMIGPGDSVLLVVEEAFGYEAKQLRDRTRERVFPVEDLPNEADLEGLRISMGFEPDGFDLERARYRKVCIVATEESPVRDWVASFFVETMAALVASDRLHVCSPPFDRTRAVVIRPAR